MDTVRLDEGLLRTTAPNGLVVLTETLPGVRSAAVGIYVRTASAHERREQMGISHLLEHMVFKGTERRTAKRAGARARGAGRQPRRLHRPRLHQLPGARPRRGPAARGRDPHRSGAPAAAPGERPRARAQRDPRGDQRRRRHAGRSRLRAARRRRCGPSTPTATPFSARPRPWPRSPPTICGACTATRLLPRQLRGRRRGQRGPRPAARRCSSGRAGSRATGRAAAPRRSRPRAAVRGATGARSGTRRRPTSCSAPTPSRSAIRAASRSRS